MVELGLIVDVHHRTVSATAIGRCKIHLRLPHT